MDILEQMIADEKIPGAFEAWEPYRIQLTNYIIEQCESKKAQKPVLGIWGAGEANDLDLKKLSCHYRLVLIDRDQDSLRTAIWKYGLEDAEIICGDLLFWNIAHETYELFEALLKEAEEVDVVIEFLHLIAEGNSHALQICTDYKLDYSVCIGLHSQLNARLAGLVYAYRRHYDTEDLKKLDHAIRALNAAAVTRLNDMMYAITEHRIIFGYEVTAIGKNQKDAEVLKLVTENQPEQMRQLIRVEGALQLEQDIALHNGWDMEITSDIKLIWPFRWQEDKKSYCMELVSARKIL